MNYLFRSSKFKVAWACCIALVVTSVPARSQDYDDSLLIYSVNIQLSSATATWSGTGIYLGNGMFLTAAHVVGRSWMTKPKVVIGGEQFPTRVVKEGTFEGTDLTLLSVEASLLPMRFRLRRNALCKDPPWPGELVVTVAPEGIARSHVISAARLPAEARKFSTIIADVVRTGNSGSGVFDSQKRCLLGIMSRKISQRTRSESGKLGTRDIAKFFVPVSEITAFLPAEAKFN